MKPVNRFFLFLCALVLVCALVSPAAAEEDHPVLTFPAGLREIGEGAFCPDGSLHTVVLPEGLEIIGAKAFCNSSIVSVTLPRSLKSIGEDAFAGCRNLTASVYQGSLGETYCRENRIPYQLIKTELTGFSFLQGDRFLPAFLDIGDPGLVFTPENCGWTIYDLVWSSSDNNVCNCRNGYLCAGAPGEAVITASLPDGSMSASCRIVVTPDGQPLTSETEKLVKLINVALSQVGYHEKASPEQLEDFTANSGGAEYNKYAYYFDKQARKFYNGEKNGYPWCEVFADWCFVQAFGYSQAQAMTYQFNGCAGAGCVESYRYYKDHGRVGTEPRIGAQVYYGTTEKNLWHTGIVVQVTDDIILAIEGNWNNGVSFHQTYRNFSNSIFGYGYPNF